MPPLFARESEEHCQFLKKDDSSFPLLFVDLETAVQQKEI